MTEQDNRARRGLLADRKREKEAHLQGAFDLNAAQKKKSDGFTAVRVSDKAMEVIDDVYFEERLKRKADAVDRIIEVYLKHKDD